MRREHLRFSVCCLVISLLLAGIPWGVAQAEVAGPGWVRVTADPISPEEAREHYQARALELEANGPAETYPQAVAAAAGQAGAAGPEIAELARALQHDPVLIYEYVRNHVDYVPYFGLLKGATLTYLDGAGNDFDQAALMIALLRESGYPAEYVYGTMTIPVSATDQKDLKHWLSVDAGLFTSLVVSDVLGNGGIPATPSNDGDSFLVHRVWVKATINGQTYLFDPAFKPYLATPGIDLATAMGYTRNAFLAAAGGTIGTDYVQGLNEAGITSALESSSMRLVNVLKAYLPNASLSEIIGGREIVPQYLEGLPSSLDFPVDEEYNTWTDIPAEYVHTVRITHGEIDRTLNIPDLAGRKLAIVYEAANLTAAAPAAGEPVATPAGPVTTSGPERALPGHLAAGDGTGVKLPLSNTADFGKIYPDGASELTWTLTNSYTFNIQIKATLSSNPSNAYSIVAGGGTVNVGVGATHTITVRLSGTGQAAGTKTGTLYVEWCYVSGSRFADDSVSLTGVVAARPDWTGSYGFPFGANYLGRPVDGTARFKNSGGLSLTITGISLAGPDAARFQITGGGQSGTLGPGLYRDIAVRYRADSVGSHSAYVHVTYTYDGFNYALDCPLSGQTVRIPGAQLLLDDQLLADETEPVTGDLHTLTIAIEHPYSTDDWDQTVTYTLQRGATYAIVYDFGGSRLGRLVEKRERQLQAYRNQGLADTSPEVLTETLNVMGMTWMRDTTLASNLFAQLAGVIDVRHHRFGIVAQEAGYYVDIKAQLSTVVARGWDTVAEDAYLRASGQLGSALEHGVLEQMQVNRPAVSTVKLLQINNASGKKVFKATPANFAAVKTQLVNYSTEDLAALEASIGQGLTLILPIDGRLGLGNWSGKGYIEYGLLESRKHFGWVIAPGHYGGYGAEEASVEVYHVQDQVDASLYQSFEPVLAADPVDMASGAWVYHNTDLALRGGMGGIALRRSYNSGSNTIEQSLGPGWTHNYDLYVETHSSSP
ncbi:MAG: choice-of-anchor D domain-containing protein, partial [Thermodesulfobacteriota bacterium]